MTNKKNINSHFDLALLQLHWQHLKNLLQNLESGLTTPAAFFLWTIFTNSRSRLNGAPIMYGDSTTFSMWYMGDGNRINRFPRPASGTAHGSSDVSAAARDELAWPCTCVRTFSDKTSVSSRATRRPNHASVKRISGSCAPSPAPLRDHGLQLVPAMCRPQGTIEHSRLCVTQWAVNFMALFAAINGQSISTAICGWSFKVSIVSFSSSR